MSDYFQNLIFVECLFDSRIHLINKSNLQQDFGDLKTNQLSQYINLDKFIAVIAIVTQLSFCLCKRIFLNAFNKRQKVVLNLKLLLYIIKITKIILFIDQDIDNLLGNIKILD